MGVRGLLGLLAIVAACNRDPATNSDPDPLLDPLVGTHQLDSLDGAGAPFGPLAEIPLPGCTSQVDSARLRITPFAPSGMTGLGFSLEVRALAVCTHGSPTPLAFGMQGAVVHLPALTFLAAPSGLIVSAGSLTTTHIRMPAVNLSYLGTHDLVFVRAAQATAATTHHATHRTGARGRSRRSP